MTHGCDRDTDEFKEWVEQLNVYGKKKGFDGNITDESGAENWFIYFQDGYSPEEAYEEDASYG